MTAVWRKKKKKMKESPPPYPSKKEKNIRKEMLKQLQQRRARRARGYISKGIVWVFFHNIVSLQSFMAKKHERRGCGAGRTPEKA